MNPGNIDLFNNPIYRYKSSYIFNYIEPYRDFISTGCGVMASTLSPYSREPGSSLHIADFFLWILFSRIS